ncbi:hypothetical protein MBLNU230_g7937t1 [Neophaeotheca triangularis]
MEAQHESAKPSVVLRLLDMECEQVPNDKSATFFEDVLLLKVDELGESVLKLNRDLDAVETGDYVAVSYCWNEPNPKRNMAGAYDICYPSAKPPRSNKVRNEVLDRVIRYAEVCETPYIWIDQECSPQIDGEAKQQAINSMDLIYRVSSYPVGLLAVELSSQEEVDALEDLMSSRCVEWEPWRDDADPRLTEFCCPQTVLRVLQQLYDDPWWTRGWIYQEDYLSSIALDLLIRRGPNTNAPDFGLFEDEMCLPMTTFREQATLFLHACQTEQLAMARPYEGMLQRFAKFNVLYHLSGDAKGKAMSARIIADVQQRQTGKEHDCLRIAANSCDYAIRFNPCTMLEKEHDVQLCLLAMYLLNGEILRDSQQIETWSPETDVGAYLNRKTTAAFDPPVKSRHLTYLKGCRLPQVTFEREGIQTKGHLWIINDVLRTKCWSLPTLSRKRKRRDHRAPRLDDYHRGRLESLASRLSQGPLQRRLRGYLAEEFQSATRSPAERHMDLMAISVAEAISADKTLHLASSSKSPDDCGIFVGLPDEMFRGAPDPFKHVYTSWSNHMHKDKLRRQLHVSLAVRHEGVGTEGKPLLSTVQWVNGLVFYSTKNETDVVFKWPPAWM